MGVRTVVEFNHDQAYMLDRDPDGFVFDLRTALNSGDKRDWQRLERFGLREIVQRHHSDNGEVVIGSHKTRYPLP